MCVYCMISDWGRDHWVPQIPQSPNYPFYPPNMRPSLDEFEKLVKRVKELEDQLGISCPGNEHKQEWIKELRDKLDEIERRADGQA